MLMRKLKYRWIGRGYSFSLAHLRPITMKNGDRIFKRRLISQEVGVDRNSNLYRQPLLTNHGSLFTLLRSILKYPVSYTYTHIIIQSR